MNERRFDNRSKEQFIGDIKRHTSNENLFISRAVGSCPFDFVCKKYEFAGVDSTGGFVGKDDPRYANRCDPDIVMSVHGSKYGIEVKHSRSSVWSLKKYDANNYLRSGYGLLWGASVGGSEMAGLMSPSRFGKFIGAFCTDERSVPIPWMGGKLGWTIGSDSLIDWTNLTWETNEQA